MQANEGGVVSASHWARSRGTQSPDMANGVRYASLHPVLAEVICCHNQDSYRDTGVDPEGTDHVGIVTNSTEA